MCTYTSTHIYTFFIDVFCVVLSFSVSMRSLSSTSPYCVLKGIRYIRLGPAHKLLGAYHM